MKLEVNGVIPAGRAKIVRLNEKRYYIYLTAGLNHVWSRIHKQGIKVEVYIVLPAGEEGGGAGGENR